MPDYDDLRLKYNYGSLENPPYYVTAYGIAVKHGYQGTEEEWIHEIQESAHDSSIAAAESAEAAAGSADTAEAFGAGTRGGEPLDEDDPAYHNNAQYYSANADTKAAAAADSAEDSEAYAIGKRSGVDVDSDDPAYHNNSKYYSDLAKDYAEDTGGLVTTTVTGWLAENVDPETGYVLDRSLASSEAAAPADLVGEVKSAIDADYTALLDGKYLFPARFERGNIANNGIRSNLSYRIRSVDRVSFATETIYKIGSGFQAKKIIWNGSTLLPSNIWYTDTITFTPEYTYDLLIARVTEDTSEVADIATFAKAVYRDSVGLAVTLLENEVFGVVDSTFPLTFVPGTYYSTAVGNTLEKYYGGGYDKTRKVVGSTVFNAPCAVNIKAKSGYAFTVFFASNGVISGTSGLVTDYALLAGHQYGITLRTTSGTDDISKVPTESIIDIDYMSNIDDLQAGVYHHPYGIEPFQMSLFAHTDNLFSDFCNYITGGYYRATLNPPTKLRITETTNWKSWLIKVKPNTTYTVGPLDFQLYMFDANLICTEIIYPSATPPSDTEPNTFVTGPRSCWMSLTQRIERDMSRWMMVEGDTYPSDYISGYPQWVAYPKAPNAEMKHITFAYNTYPIQVIYDASEATIVIPGGTRMLTRKGVVQASLGATTLTASSPQFIYYNYALDQWFLGTGSTSPGDDLYFVGWVNPTAKSAYIQGYVNEIEAKRIAFMGDSITAGVATTKVYHEFIHDRYGWRCLNYGYGGAGYYRSYPGYNAGKLGTGAEGMGVPITADNYFVPNNVVARLAEVSPTTTDGIVIFAGTNDWGNDVSVDNYISGIEAAFEYCKTYFPTIPVLVMTPIHRKDDTTPNSQGKTLREYVDILIAECKKYSMAYVDCMTMTGLYPDILAQREAFFASNLSSGLHPSVEGHKRIASVVGATLKEIIDCHDF